MTGLASFFRKETRAALRRLAVSAALALCCGAAAAFLCVAGFIVALERYGAVDACLGAAAAFLVAAVILAAVRLMLAERRRREADAAPALSALADPRALLIGLQIAQVVGLKRLAPLLAVGAAAMAFSAARPAAGRRRAARSRRDEADIAARNAAK